MPRVLSPFEQQFIPPHGYSKSKGPVIKTDAAVEGKGQPANGRPLPRSRNEEAQRRDEAADGASRLSERWAQRNKMVKVNAVLTDEGFS